MSAMGDFFILVAERSGLDLDDPKTMEVVMSAYERTPLTGTTHADIVNATVETIKREAA